MESCHNREVNYAIKFYSGAEAPHDSLSNFKLCPNGVIHEGIKYPSSEHAFQALRVPREMRARLFSVDSDIGVFSPEAFVNVGVPPRLAEKKCKYWSRKQMIGILAKMRIKRISGASELTREQCERGFIEILLAKYSANEMHRKVLLDTEDEFLLEFVRSSVSKFKKAGVIDRWGGMLHEGRIVGHNQQGSLQMHVRELIRGGNV